LVPLAPYGVAIQQEINSFLHAVRQMQIWSIFFSYKFNQ